uniref:CSC1-like protein At3g54510 n=1 Tax=Rhizophora mucronata TaxID=61149 RepID=A0A2P2IQJ8_RHIMU
MRISVGLMHLTLIKRILWLLAMSDLFECFIFCTKIVDSCNLYCVIKMNFCHALLLQHMFLNHLYLHFFPLGAKSSLPKNGLKCLFN